MKKLGIVLLIVFTLVGCNGKDIKEVNEKKTMFCATPGNSGDTWDVTIVYSDDVIESISLSMPDYDMEDIDYAIKIDEEDYGNLDIKGYTMTYERDDSISFYKVMLTFDLKELDVDKAFERFYSFSLFTEVLGNEKYKGFNDYKNML